MGLFDFVRDVGAKVGIGDSTAEIAAKEAVEKQKAELEKQHASMAAAKAKDDAARAKAAEEHEATVARRRAAASKRRSARIREERSEVRRSYQLEKYVMDLGLECEDLDISYDDGKAYVSGLAPSSEMREKIILAVGNAEGVNQVEDDIEVEAPAPDAVFHTVQSGDTLSAIAKAVYGDANRYPEIFEANKPMLTDPNLIYPGQVLRCPK